MDKATKDEIVEQLIQFVRVKFALADSLELTREMSLLDSGIVDSMGVLDLVTFIEQQFGIVAEDDDLVAENFESIDSLVRFVEEKQ